MASIRKRNGKYQVQIRRDGKLAGSRTFHTQKDAREWARQFEARLDRGDLEPRARDLRSFTLRDIVVRYRDEVVPSKKTTSVETFVLNAFLRHPICSKRLDQLKLSDFASYRDERLKSISPASLKRQLAPIAHAFTIAKTEWDVPLKENPLTGLRLKTIDNRRERRLRPGEYETLLDAARTRRNPMIERVVIFAVETAMRRGEILGLHWDQVDLKNRTVIVLEPKNGFTRRIPLTHKALSVLQTQRHNQSRVFPMTHNTLRMAWQRMLKLTDIKDLHFHDLRHEAVSRFFEIGLTVPEVASISGHRELKMLMRYAHADAAKVSKKLLSNTGN